MQGSFQEQWSSRLVGDEKCIKVEDGICIGEGDCRGCVILGGQDTVVATRSVKEDTLQ